MADGGKLQHYENVFSQTLTIAEVCDKFKDSYPLVARLVRTGYESHSLLEQNKDTDILLEKSTPLQFVLVRILDVHDKERTKEEKDEDFVKTRKAYIGKELLLPICYSGNFKLINKPGRLCRYTSVGQIITDLPRFLRLNQDTKYDPPDRLHTPTTLTAGTTIEVKNVKIIENVRYIKCKSSKGTYIFREDFPINCTAVDDPDDHTFMNLAGEFVLLPKDIQFTNVWPDDVILKDDDEARVMLILLGGPIRILRSFIRRNVFTIRIHSEAGQRKTVGLIPRQIWSSQLVQLRTFDTEATKQDYIRNHFGDNLDSNCIVNGLYMLKPVETDIVWLIAPATKTKESQTAQDYEVLEKKRVDYENVMTVFEDYDEPLSTKRDVLVIQSRSAAQTDPLGEMDDYENPYPPDEFEPIVPPRPASLAASRRSYSDTNSKVALPVAKVALPVAKPRDVDMFTKIREKAKLGFDKVHEQLLKRRVKLVQQTAEKNASERRKRMYGRSMSDNDITRVSRIVEEKRISKSVSRKEDIGDETQCSQGLFRAYLHNKERPLPEIPSNSINVTDDDKLDTYGDVKDKAYVQKKTVDGQEIVPVPTDTLARYPDLHKIGKTGQTKMDFYCYTVKELVECLKMCRLEQFATTCYENRLDGAFFKDFELNQLEAEPFCLSKLDVIKFKKIIEDGWRPKLSML